MMSINEITQPSPDHFSSPIDFVEENNKNIFITRKYWIWSLILATIKEINGFDRFYQRLYLF